MSKSAHSNVIDLQVEIVHQTEKAALKATLARWDGQPQITGRA